MASFKDFKVVQTERALHKFSIPWLVIAVDAL